MLDFATTESKVRPLNQSAPTQSNQKTFINITEDWTIMSCYMDLSYDLQDALYVQSYSGWNDSVYSIIFGNTIGL